MQLFQENESEMFEWLFDLLQAYSKAFFIILRKNSETLQNRDRLIINFPSNLVRYIIFSISAKVFGVLFYFPRQLSPFVYLKLCTRKKTISIMSTLFLNTFDQSIFF